MKKSTFHKTPQRRNFTFTQKKRNFFGWKTLFSPLVVLFLFTINHSLFSQTATYTSNGSFTVPAGVTTITVEVWGGGGRGGNRTSSGVCGGGGGGAYSKSVLNVTPGASNTVNVGVGSTSTAAGGDSWFGTSTTVMAKGGNSVADNSATGVSGGSEANGVGDIKYSGGDGSSSSGGNSGAGGGGAGSTGNGGNASGTTAGTGTASGGGNGGNGLTANGSGNTGSISGGGGSGEKRGTLFNYFPGNGAAGKAIITYTCPTYALTTTSAVTPVSAVPGSTTVTLSGLPDGNYTVTYTRSLPAASGLTASMTVTSGTGTFTATGLTQPGSSTITVTNLASGVTPNICSNAISANNTAVVEVSVKYKSEFISMNVGAATWCAGETRTVSVTVKNAGTETWTDAGADVNIGIKWDAEADYFVRTDAGNLAPGATQTYSLTVTAPATIGVNHLTFDVVKEGDCWFANNTGSCGPGNTVYQSVLLTINPLPNGSLSGNAICQGGTGQFTFAGSSPGTYNLVISGVSYPGVVSGTPFNASPNPTSTTSYTLESVTDANNCTRTTGFTQASVTIAVNDDLSSLTVAPAAAQSICENTAGNLLTVTESGGGAKTRQWGKSLVSGGSYTAIGSETGTTFTPTGANLGTGQWYVVCTTTPACGAVTTSNEVMVTVNALPIVNITGAIEICINGTTTLSSNTGGTWVSNNPSVATVDPNTGDVTGVAAGTVTFTFTSSAAPNCANTTGSVTVTGNPVADFTATPAYIPEGGSVTFTNTSTPVSGTTWLWSFPGGTPATSPDQNPTVTYPSSGVYDVTLTATNLCNTDDEIKTGFITVYASALYSAPGNGSFNVPACVNSITAEVWGGGGRGGTSTNTSETGGGGGGAYSRKTFTGITPGTNFSFTIGIGSTSATAGGDTWFENTTSLLAKGGNSVSNNTLAGATGGLSSNGYGDFKTNGGRGANGSDGNFGGGGGSSGGTSMNGNYLNSTTSVTGATAPSGGGNGGNGSQSAGNGSSGSSPGGGGGGVRSADGQTGGPGANGQILITWVVTGTPPAAPATTGTTICSGSTATLSASGADAGEKYKWYSAAVAGTLLKTSTDENDNTYSPGTLTTTTNYWVSRITASGCEGDRTQVTATVKPSPTSVISVSPSAICSGSPTTVSIALTGAAPWALTWSDGTTSTPVTGINTSPYTFTVNPTVNTTYTVTVLSDLNCPAQAGDMTGTAAVTIITAPVPTNPGNQAVCESGGGAPHLQ